MMGSAKGSHVLARFASPLLLGSGLAFCEEPPPNIILIQADDLGYSDLSLHGNPVIRTPHLDRLGKDALRFERFYVNSVCAPTRAALLTGRQFLRTGVWGVHGGTDFMNLDEVTLAEALRTAGYTTGMWGKWHVGKADGYYPWDRGFDEAYFAALYRYRDNKGLLNGRPHPLKGWTCEKLTDMAIDFIRTERDKPFFAYLPYLTPHAKWDAPPAEIEEYRAKGLSPNFATLAGMITFMDKNIGRLLAAVDAAGLRENTIVIFMSDNGPTQNNAGIRLTPEEWKLRNSPALLRGRKAHNWENGIRSPLFVRWPKVLTPGVCTKPVNIMDIFPTLVEVANASPSPNAKPLDGRSILPLLKTPDGAWPERDLLVCRHYCKAIDPNWDSKLVVRGPDQEDGLIADDYKYLLGEGVYDLGRDPRETRSLGAERKTLEKAMHQQTVKLYRDILQEEGCFSRPVFVVGQNESSQTMIWAYGASRITGGLRNENHALANWRGDHDTATYDLLVRTPGTYVVSIPASTAERDGTGPLGSGSLIASTGADSATAPVCVGEQGDLTACKGLALQTGRTRLTLSLGVQLPEPVALHRIYLQRKE